MGAASDGEDGEDTDPLSRDSKLNTADLISPAPVWAAAQAGSQGSVLAHPGTSSHREWR